MSSLGLPVLVALFVAAAAAVWIAGIKVSETTDVLAGRLGLGDALGGLIVLAVVTNLPELAIVCSGAASGDLSLAVGNILGGIAAQTVVLALLDRFGSPPGEPLTYRAASLLLVLEGLLVVVILGLVLVGTQMPADQVFARTTPVTLMIVVTWMAGVKLIAAKGHALPWHDTGHPPEHQEVPRGAAKRAAAEKAAEAKRSTAAVGATFGIGALVTLVAGVVLEQSSGAIADRIGMSGAIFGATVLAAATSLPELSTGLTSVRLGDYEMAFGDIFGGNAFLPVLFAAAVAISGKAVLPAAGRTDLYLTAGGIVVTVIYLGGLIVRPRRTVVGVGVDSALVLATYAVLVVGLAFV
ncbi:MAG: hypothetical protein R2701_10750 [Acidimicrobiales bacterium]|nr:hypothetical protein [Acidimicrobiales bacterium]